jgi:hypothetical protein
MAEYAQREAPTRRRSGTRSSGGTTAALKGGAAAGLSTAALLDIVERLGLVDIIIDRVKEKLDEVDVDDFIDEVASYLKRNPEVLVVSLGAITLTAGALVYLNRRNEGGAARRRMRAVEDH